MTNPIVIISGADTATGLTTARSLRSAGYTVWGLVENNNSACSKSNNWHEIHFVSNDELNRLSGLLKILESAKEITKIKPLLLFSSDDWVLWADSVRYQLGVVADLILPSSDDLSVLMDKTKFHRWALVNDFSVPVSIVADDKKQLTSALQGMEAFPYIVKPLVRLDAWDSEYPNEKFLTVRNREDAEAINDRADNLYQCSPSYVVQQWIAGEDSDVYFCLFAISEHGEAIAKFSGRKLLQWPRNGGSTALCVRVDNTKLVNQAENILQSSGARGLCSVEFKYCRSSDEYYITEPTIGRNDYQSFIAVACGVNITRLLVDQHFGSTEKIDTSLKNAIWVDEVAFLRAIKQRPISFFKKIGSLLTYSVWRVSPLLFRFMDIKPFFYTVKNLVSSETKK